MIYVLYSIMYTIYSVQYSNTVNSLLRYVYKNNKISFLDAIHFNIVLQVIEHHILKQMHTYININNVHAISR